MLKCLQSSSDKVSSNCNILTLFVEETTGFSSSPSLLCPLPREGKLPISDWSGFSDSSTPFSKLPFLLVETSVIVTAVILSVRLCSPYFLLSSSSISSSIILSSTSELVPSLIVLSSMLDKSACLLVLIFQNKFLPQHSLISLIKSFHQLMHS